MNRSKFSTRFFVIYPLILLSLLLTFHNEYASADPDDSTVYHIEAVGHPTIARHGNKEGAAVVLAVNSSQGPVTGLVQNNFQVKAGPVAAGGCDVELKRVVSYFPGRYLLEIVPYTANPACIWKKGRYVIAVLISKGNSSGVGVTELDIPGESLACADELCSGSIEVVRSSGPIAPGVSGVTITRCPTGYRAVGGGFSFNDPNVSNPSFRINQNEAGTASGGASAWLVGFKNTGSQQTNMATSVICLKAE